MAGVPQTSNAVGVGVLETIVAEHAGEAFFEVPTVGPNWLPRVPADFQEASLTDSTQHLSKCVCPETGHP